MSESCLKLHSLCILTVFIYLLYIYLLYNLKRGLAMTEALYFLDCYLKEFEATVEKVTDNKFVVLDRTAFYPESGGQPGDTGKLVRESDGAEFNVLYVGKFDGDISHEVAGENVSNGLKASAPNS
jgi:Ser-tRNA(Ala) deacylase AlaX